MNEILETLTQLANDDTTLGHLELLDTCYTTAATLCQRPHDIDRVAAVVYELVTEVAYARRQTVTT